MGKTEQKKYSKEIEAIVENMSLMDDDLMARVFDENIPATQLLLRTILSRDVEVIEAKGQWDLKNPLVEGRNIRLDVFAKRVCVSLKTIRRERILCVKRLKTMQSSMQQENMIPESRKER